MAIAVSDSLSNTPEHIEEAAKAIGRSPVRRQVFEAIYHHKARIKTVADIVARTRLSRLRVLQEAGQLANKGIVKKAKKDGDTAYEKIDFFHAHKRRILRYVAQPRELAKLPTKRRIGGGIPKIIRVSSQGAKVTRVTIDDLASFAKVRKHKTAGSLPAALSEEQFKSGIQKILGEPGTFKDWGGEKHDLFSTRVRVDSKRLSAAFAFKGPGLNAPLVPGKMGKNGDQALRLFQTDAEVFIVQHWREIKDSVLELMRSLAVVKSIATGHRIYYGIIDGWDSDRVYRAYLNHFSRGTTRKR